MANTKSIKVSRKNILDAMMNAEVKALTLAILREDVNDDITQEAFDEALNKWHKALNKPAKSSAGKDDDYIANEVVPYVVGQDHPVTASDVNAALINAPRANRASSLLRRACDLGLLSRDKVRKNASYVYSAPDYDWESYIAEYDAKVKAKAEARIAKARANRS